MRIIHQKHRKKTLLIFLSNVLSIFCFSAVSGPPIPREAACSPKRRFITETCRRQKTGILRARTPKRARSEDTGYFCFSIVSVRLSAASV